MVVQGLFKIDELASWCCHAVIIVAFRCGVFELAGYWLQESNIKRCKLLLRRRKSDGVYVHSNLHSNFRGRRLGSNKKRLEEYQGPIIAGTRGYAGQKKDKQPTPLNITTQGYFDYLALYSMDSAAVTDKQARWIERLSVFKTRQRAFGTTEQLKKWPIRYGWSRVGTARS
jgi:hypothetical protein